MDNFISAIIAWWQQEVNIMLEKNPGDLKIYRLPIIALQETDFNQINQLLLAWPPTHNSEDKSLIPTMQYGSESGKHCYSTILNKQITFHQTKVTAAFIENGAIGYFDRMVNPVLILCLRKLGTHPKAVESLALTCNTQYTASKQNTASLLQPIKTQITNNFRTWTRFYPRTFPVAVMLQSHRQLHKNHNTHIVS